MVAKAEVSSQIDYNVLAVQSINENCAKVCGSGTTVLQFWLRMWQYAFTRLVTSKNHLAGS